MGLFMATTRKTQTAGATTSDLVTPSSQQRDDVR
jgi:hypothetical protein